MGHTAASARRASNAAAAFSLAAVRLRELWRTLEESFFDPYRPELHYMRGPGPKWRAKHQPRLRFESEAVRPGGQHELSPVYVRPRDSGNLAR